LKHGKGTAKPVHDMKAYDTVELNYTHS